MARPLTGRGSGQATTTAAIIGSISPPPPATGHVNLAAYYKLITVADLQSRYTLCGFNNTVKFDN